MQLSQVTIIEGRYLLRERIATHGPVEVYAAHDEHLDRPVTVQLLGESADANAARAFLRHQQLASSIHNCPLFAVYDAGEWNGRPYSVMEREKGVLPGALNRPGYPPDLALVLRVTRQVGESLACCREAGLTDWNFAPEAVRIDAEGNGCLAVLEGLNGGYSSSHPGADARALHALVLLMLAGRADADEATLRAALVPEVLLSFLRRVATGANPQMRTARDVVREVEALERASVQPTQAYTPAPDGGSPKPSDDTVPIAAFPALHPSEAPTVAAQLMPASPGPPPVPHFDDTPTPYTPPAGVEGSRREPKRLLPALLLLGGLLLMAVLLFAVAPLLARPSTSAESAGVSQASAASSPRVAVPGLLGKTLDEAREIAGSNNLNLADGEPLHDAGIAKDAIAWQEPPPGTEVQAGSLVTVSLSLGPEPQPTEQPPQVQPAPDQPPSGNQNKKGGKKGRDKDDSDD